MCDIWCEPPIPGDDEFDGLDEQRDRDYDLGMYDEE